MRKTILISFSLTCAAILTWDEAAAQEVVPDNVPHGSIAIGPGVVPEYDGADTMRVIPFVIADLRWGGVGLEIRGLRARADLVSDPRLSIGPVVGARLPRQDVSGALGRLPEIGTAIEAGGFVGYRFGGDRLGQGSVQLELSALQDVSRTHNGLLATGAVSYAAVRQADVLLSFDLQTTWANSDYAETYFGVDPASGLAAGLPVYRPGSGFRDVGAGLTADYSFNRRIGVIARAGATYLAGDIGDSPVAAAGSRWQPAAGIALSYRF